VQLTLPRVETSFDTEPKLFLAPGVGLDYLRAMLGIVIWEEKGVCCSKCMTMV